MGVDADYQATVHDMVGKLELAALRCVKALGPGTEGAPSPWGHLPAGWDGDQPTFDYPMSSVEREPFEVPTARWEQMLTYFGTPSLEATRETHGELGQEGAEEDAQGAVYVLWRMTESGQAVVPKLKESLESWKGSQDSSPALFHLEYLPQLQLALENQYRFVEALALLIEARVALLEHGRVEAIEIAGQTARALDENATWTEQEIRKDVQRNWESLGERAVGILASTISGGPKGAAAKAVEIFGSAIFTGLVEPVGSGTVFAWEVTDKMEDQLAKLREEVLAREADLHAALEELDAWLVTTGNNDILPFELGG